MTIVAEKIRQAVQDMAQPHSASPFGHITVSVGGVHVMAPVQNDPARYIGLADSALYQAKASGRDRIVATHFSDQPASAYKRPKMPDFASTGSTGIMTPNPRATRNALLVSTQTERGRRG